MIDSSGGSPWPVRISVGPSQIPTSTRRPLWEGHVLFKGAYFACMMTILVNTLPKTQIGHGWDRSPSQQRGSTIAIECTLGHSATRAGSPPGTVCARGLQ